MQLERIAIQPRLRTPWQAIDLGTALARHSYRPLLLAWAIPNLLLFALLALLLPTAWLWCISLLLWWLKPLWDSFPLYMASRRLFGEQVSLRQAWLRAPRLLGRELLAWLTWRRLSPSRSADLPVTLLEQLRGQPRHMRLAVLHHGSSGAAGWLTVTCAHLEGAISIGCAGLLALLLPEQMDFDLLGFYLSEERTPQLVIAAVTLLSAALVAPFYVCAGFALYINRRVALEGWDIEVRFRQLAARQPAAAVRAALALLLCTGALALLPPAPALAQEQEQEQEQTEATEAAAQPDRSERAAVRQRIDSVLADEEFGRTETVTRWRLKPTEAKEQGIPDWLITLAETLERIGLLGARDWLVGAAQVLKYGLGLLLAVLLIWLLWRYRDALRRWAPHPLRQRHKTPPAALFGLDLRRESLPDDPLSSARALWPQQPRAALALLYRAALVQLLARGCPLRDHHTEGECAALARHHLAPGAAALFAELTALWQQLAYAHRLPLEAQMSALWPRWAAEFNDA